MRWFAAWLQERRGASRGKANQKLASKLTGIEARRTGFWMLPHFGSIAHMIRWATWEVAFVDLQHWSSKVSTTLHIAAYVCSSRVKKLALETRTIANSTHGKKDSAPFKVQANTTVDHTNRQDDQTSAKQHPRLTSQGVHQS